MKLIILPRLRLGQLQAIAKSTLTICKNLVQFASSILDVENAFVPFKAGMLKDDASAEKKGELDQKRDKRVTGFFAVIDAEEKIENEDETILASYAALMKIADKYGPSIRRLPRNEETIAIDNLLEEIGHIDITPLVPTGIPRWIPSLEATNNAYRDASSKYISDSVEADSTEAASIQAPELIDALEKLYLKIFASIALTPNDELEKAYAELEKLVDSMR
jgi:hypothetical protein